MTSLTPQSEQKSVTWHELSSVDLLARLAVTETGLSRAQATERLARYGRNQLPQKAAVTWWKIAFRQFKSPLIYILTIAAVVSLFLHPDDPVDAIFIASVLVLNAVIGGYQEWKADQSSRALQNLLKIRASVFRDGEISELDAEEVVPGDIIWLESGNRVPADMRLLLAHGLEVDESLLTGESFSVLKDSAWIGDGSEPMVDRYNMAYAGSIIVRGRGKGVVVATGEETVVGQLALDVLSSTGGRPPLLERMERFTQVVAYSVLIAAASIAVIGVLFRGYEVSDMFMFGVALAVSAIPEGLPVALTVALAIAATRMARRGVIVRRLAAVEGLGSCTFIGCDKTGTLTCNELTVRAICLPDQQMFEVTGEGFAPNGDILVNGLPVMSADHPALIDLARVSVLCNEGDLHQRDDAWVWRGDPTDLALLSMGHKLGLVREAVLSQYPQINEIPFEPEHQYAATFHRYDGSVFVAVKGAPERVLAMCSFPDRVEKSQQLMLLAESMAERGFRILALAEGVVLDNLDPAQTPPEPNNVTFLGFVGMIDPLRHGVREAVAACHSAGITVCMITGDHPVTALAIARDLGLAHVPDQVISGRELEAMSSVQVSDVVKYTRVFARATPRQKLELVEAARQLGHYVAVTGDGVNDAPALRQANIGVAMGKAGTDVAREAAELVLTDDNFASIVAGVEEGRVAYDNIRKVIYLLISTGAAEVVLLGLAIVTGWPNTSAGLAILPLLPAQLLWLNLVTNGIQDVALAFEPGEKGALQRKPRPPKERIFNRLMVERTLIAAIVIAVVGFGSFCWMIEVAGWSEGQARNGLLLLMVLFENIHIANCRSETTSAFRLSLFSSPILLGGTTLAFLVHMISMQIPFMQRILRIEPVDLTTFISLLGLALTILAALEIHKWSWKVRRRH
ncbi:MAG: HAD-IC family P-type ATPase [Proteobacteria bacterium]|nr:HAD-IC family P-type ATPase [Desulfobulbaceae bacterium]MBU4153254.1 HAD-IC family P-type ATPase [Pseudomonadota bacterium]